MKEYNKIATFAMIMIIVSVPLKVQAARLDKTSYVTQKGITSKITIKGIGAGRIVNWKVSGKAVKVSGRKRTATIKAVRNGNAIVTAKVNGTWMRCRITVAKPKRKLDLQPNKPILLEIGKNPIIKSNTHPEIAEVAKVGDSIKVIPKKAGTTKIVVKTAKSTITKNVVVKGTAEKPGTPKKPKQPGTEPGTEKPQTEQPGTEPETEPTTESTQYSFHTPDYDLQEQCAITNRNFYVGQINECAKCGYKMIIPPFVISGEYDTWTEDERRKEFENMNPFARRYLVGIISDKNMFLYRPDVKETLLGIMNESIVLTDELIHTLGEGVLNDFNQHMRAGCNCNWYQKTATWPGPYECVPLSKYDEWKKNESLYFPAYGYTGENLALQIAFENWHKEKYGENCDCLGQEGKAPAIKN